MDIKRIPHVIRIRHKREGIRVRNWSGKSLTHGKQRNGKKKKFMYTHGGYGIKKQREKQQNITKRLLTYL